MGLYEAIKDGVEVARKADNIEVMKQLLDAQKEALDLFEENRELRARIRALEEKAATSGSLTFRDNKYWREDGATSDGPFCTTCWDIESRLVRMHKSSRSDRDSFFCDWCTYHRRK